MVQSVHPHPRGATQAEKAIGTGRLGLEMPKSCRGRQQKKARTNKAERSARDFEVSQRARRCAGGISKAEALAAAQEVREAAKEKRQRKKLARVEARENLKASSAAVEEERARQAQEQERAQRKAAVAAAAAARARD